MVTISTSYFARDGRSPGAVSIARYPPKFYDGPVYRPLAPFGWMLKIEDWDDYVQAYQKYVLDKLDAETVVKHLSELTGSESVVMLCFERDPAECHRSLVARWLERSLQITVNELAPPPKPEPKKTQVTLSSFW